MPFMNQGRAEEGIVPGGGVAFLRAIEAVENASDKPRAMRSSALNHRRSAQGPCRQIATMPERWRSDCRANHGKQECGTAITPHGEFGDLFKLGIIDRPRSPRRRCSIRQRDWIGVDDRCFVTELKEKKGEERAGCGRGGIRNQFSR